MVHYVCVCVFVHCIDALYRHGWWRSLLYSEKKSLRKINHFHCTQGLINWFFSFGWVLYAIFLLSECIQKILGFFFFFEDKVIRFVWNLINFASSCRWKTKRNDNKSFFGFDYCAKIISDFLIFFLH